MKRVGGVGLSVVAGWVRADRAHGMARFPGGGGWAVVAARLTPFQHRGPGIKVAVHPCLNARGLQHSEAPTAVGLRHWLLLAPFS